MISNAALASFDAAVTLASLPCLVLGWRAARRGRYETHRNWMLAACACGLAFLLAFAARFYLYGMTPFRGQRAWQKALYYALYFSHEPLAVLNVALAGAALGLGLADRREAHREVAVVALPVWLYVALTGLALYLALYVFF